MDGLDGSIQIVIVGLRDEALFQERRGKRHPVDVGYVFVGDAEWYQISFAISIYLSRSSIPESAE